MQANISQTRADASGGSRVRSASTPYFLRPFAWLLYLTVSILFLVAGRLAQADVASVLPAFYAEPGFHDKWRQTVSGINEHVDPFSGSLQVSHTDMVIPGNGGLDIVIQRSYTSNIFLSRPSPLSNPPFPSTLLSQSPAGMGWTLHFGRAVKSQSDNRINNHICSTDFDPNLGDTTLDDGVLELPDGSMDTLTTSAAGIARFITRKNWLANCTPSSDGLIVFAPNGLKYTMNHAVTSFDDVTYTTRTTTAWHTTRIEDANGNFITISYAGQRGSYALVSQITSSDGRLVNFSYLNGYLSGITANNQTWTYQYATVGLRTYLTRVVRPDGLAWQYDYYPAGSVVANVLRQITYPYGATAAYTYGYADFMGDPAIQGWDNTGKMNSVVVTSKTQGGRGVEPGIWTYAYLPASDPSIESGFRNDVTTVDFPGGRHIYRHYGMQRQLQFVGTIGNREVWKTGLLKQKEIYGLNPVGGYNLIQTETYDWMAPGVFSNQRNVALVYPVFDQGVFYPQMTKKTITRDGTSYVTNYSYEVLTPGGPAVDTRPLKIVETGQQGSTLGNQATRTTDLTWYPASPARVWKFDQLLYEIVDGNNYFGTLREFDYVTGNMTGIQPRGVVERFTYDAGGNVASKTNARGWPSQYSNYYRGVPRQEIQPVGGTDPAITISRQVNDTGTVSAETNGRLFTTGFLYDTLNRITGIQKPIGFNTGVSWDATGRTVTRGNYRERSEYDGFGRATCVDATDTVLADHVTVLTRYDALGRKIFQSYPFNGSCATLNSPVGDNFTTDVLGRVVRVAHPDGTSVTTNYLAGNQVSVTNERNQATTYIYRSFGDPDNASERALMSVLAPENTATVFTRNVIGQVLTVTQGTLDLSGCPLNCGTMTNGVTRSYTYDPNNNFLLTAINPETGTTTYTRDALGNMKSRTVNGSPITNNVYDAQNRLRTIDYPGTTADVSLNYDANSNLTADFSAAGAWINNSLNLQSSRAYTYDQNDNLSRESLSVNGILVLNNVPKVTEDHTFIAQYSYNTLDQLTGITYPRGNVVSFNPNAFGWARQVAPFVSSVNYHPTGQPSSISYANGRISTFELNSRQWTQHILTSGGLVDLTYSYDGRGNVHSITDVVNSQYSRSLDYDGLDRLTTANGVWGSGTITYDAVGNIRSKVLGTDSLTYAYDGANRLANITGSRAYNFTYDVYGNIVSNNRHLFTYDDAGNLRGVSGASPANYLYDGKNMRVREASNDRVRYHFYGNSGMLLGEYDRDIAATYKEYAYLGGKLVAMRDNAPGIPPVADAGLDQTVNEASPVDLNGTGSRDPDGAISNWSWIQIAGPPVALAGQNTPTPRFTAPYLDVQTTLTFRLTVTDIDGAQASDDVNIVVQNLLLPTAAQSVLAMPGDGQTTLTWQPPSTGGSLTYNVYWSTTPGVTKSNGNRIPNVTSPYVHAGLTNGATYYYIVTAQNTNGESPDSAQMISQPGVTAWLTPLLLESNDVGNVIGPQLGVSGNGDGMVLWRQLDPSGDTTVFRQYQRATGWSAPSVVPGIPAAAMAMGSDGTAVAVWYQDFKVHASRYVPGSGWGTPTALSATGSSHTLYESTAAVDSNGNAFVVWREFVVGFYSIMVSRFDVATGAWSTPFNIVTAGITRPTLSGFVVDGAGNALVMWTSPGNSINSVSTRLYDRASGSWSPENIVFGAYDPAVAMSADGSAMLVVRSVGSAYLGAKRLSSSKVWGTGVQIEQLGNASGHRVGMDSSGNAVVMWHRAESASRVMYASHYSSVSGWNALPVRVSEMSGDATVYNLQLTFDANGNAVAAWVQRHASYTNILAARYVTGSGWRGPARLLESENQPFSDQMSLQVKLDALGNGIATWRQFNPANNLYSLWAAHYRWFGGSSPSPDAPPLAVAGAAQSVPEGALVTLDGSRSFDAEGPIASYAWTQIQGAPITLSAANTATPTFIAKVNGHPTFTQNFQATFRLTVMDAAGNSSSDAVTVSIQDLPVPALVRATSGNGQITVGWSSTSASVCTLAPCGYNVYWSTSPGVTKSNGTWISDVSRPFVHQGLTNGTRYYYVVTAVYFFNQCCGEQYVESEISAEVSATPTASVVPNVWESPVQVSSQVVYNNNYAIAADPNGNAVAIWRVHDGGTGISTLHASRYAAGAGWGASTPVSSGVASKPQVVMDGNGNALAVWLAFKADSGGTTRVVVNASRFSNGGGWESPTTVSQQTSNSNSPSLAGDASGNAIVIWVSGNQGYASRYVTGLGWQAPTTITPSSSAPKLSVDINGNAVAVWEQFNGVYARRYRANVGWETERLIDSGPGRSVFATALDAGGAAVILWGRTAANFSVDLYAVRWNADGTLSATQLLHNAFFSTFPQVVVDTSGNATAVWTERPIGQNSVVYAARYEGNTWSSPARIQSSPSDGVEAHLGIDTNGNVIAAWVTLDPVWNIYAARHSPSQGWTPDVIVESEQVNGATLCLAMAENGDAFVLWSRQDGSLWTSRFVSRKANVPPTAYTGSAQTVNPSTNATLNGSGHDVDGTIVSYRWSQIAGPPVTLVGANSATATFVAPQVSVDTVLTFQLTVTDNDGATGTGTVNVTVHINQPPTANAGAAQMVNDGTTVTLSGSGTDSDGVIASYAWIQTAGPIVTLTGANTATATFTAPQVTADTVLTFRLTVTDNQGATGSATVNVTVRHNQPPTANAGSAQTVNDGTTVTLSGSGTDIDGTIASYLWTQITGPAVTLTNANTATATFTAPIVAADTVLTFRLTVTDNGGATGTATVDVTVHHNQPPTANAGAAQTVNSGAAVTLVGSGTDSDGTIASYSWTQTVGPTVTLTNANTATASFTAPTVTTSTVLTFRLTVTDNQGATGTATVNITVNPASGGNMLQNGVPVTGVSGTTGADLNYTMQVPAGATNLSVQISGGTGDADLYVRFGSPPTQATYDCRPFIDGNNETCNFATPAAGTWHVMLHGFANFSGVTLVGSYTAGGTNTPPTASAGPDKTVMSGAAVTLPGSGTDTNGTIASYAWTQTAGPAVTLSGATTATASFTAPSVTAATVLSFQLTVTDNQGATGSDSVNVTVNPVGGGGGNQLQNGVPVTGVSGATGADLNYTFTVPAGATNLSVQISGGTGDADLYVRFGSPPTQATYDCRPFIDGNNETCNFATPAAGTWHVMLHGFANFSGVTLVGSYTP